MIDPQFKIFLGHMAGEIRFSYTDCSWEAWHQGTEAQPWTHGTGATKNDALADLRRLDWEYADYCEERATKNRHDD